VANNMAANSVTAANAALAALSVGTAAIQALAVTDAKINDLSVTKLTAGTISATISITSPTITATNGFHVTTGGVTTKIDNSSFFGVTSGLSVDDGTNAAAIAPAQIQVGLNTGSGAFGRLATSSFGGGVTGAALDLVAYNGSATFDLNLPAMTALASTVSNGSIAVPANAAGFWRVSFGGLHYKIPFYND